MAVIYKLTNTVNGLIYIGCTLDISKRMRQHKNSYSKRNNDLYKAMREFGFDKFELSIIEEVDDTIRYDREIFWIAKLKSNDNQIGYNRTIGGTGTVGYIFTEEVRKKMSQNIKGKYKPSEEQIDRICNLNKGKHLSKETRNKISQSCMGRASAFADKHHTRESIKQMLKSKEDNGVLRPVIGRNIKTDDVVKFKSLADASRYIINLRGGKYTTVISHIRNSIVGNFKAKSAYGYIWEYVEKSNDYPDRE